MLTSCVGVKECSHWQRFVEMAQLKVGTIWDGMSNRDNWRCNKEATLATTSRSADNQSYSYICNSPYENSWIMQSSVNAYLQTVQQFRWLPPVKLTQGWLLHLSYLSVCQNQQQLTKIAVYPIGKIHTEVYKGEYLWLIFFTSIDVDASLEILHSDNWPCGL